MPVLPFTSKLPTIDVVETFSGTGILGLAEGTNRNWNAYGADIERVTGDVGSYGQKVGYPNNANAATAIIDIGSSNVDIIHHPSLDQDGEATILRWRDRFNYWKVQIDDVGATLQLSLIRVEDNQEVYNNNLLISQFGYFRVIATSANIRVFVEDSFSASLTSTDQTFHLQTRHGFFLGPASARIDKWECNGL